MAASSDPSWSNAAEAYAAAAFTQPYIEKAFEKFEFVPKEPFRFLEVACGPAQHSVLAAQVVQVKGIKGAIVATDIAEGMLLKAKSRLQAIGALSTIATVQAEDAQNLSFKDHSFTHLACQFGIMFMPDYPKALREFHRVLSPSGGQVIVATWQHMDFAVFAAGYSAFLMGAPPQEKPGQGPLSIGKDPEKLKEDLVKAGFRPGRPTQPKSYLTTA